MFQKGFLLLTLLTVVFSRKHVHLLREEQVYSSQNVELTHTSRRQILKFANNTQVELLTVPDGYKFYNYSSGYCCLQLVFNYFQFPISPAPYREDFFMDPSDFDLNNFITPQKLLQAAQRRLSKETIPERKNAFILTLQENMQLSSLERFINDQIPVILLIKKRDSKTGEYVVLIGIDENNFYFEDPDKIGSIGFLPKSQLKSYWTNQTGITITFNSAKKREIVPTVRPMP